MANGLDKFLDIVAKVASIQQMANNVQQPANIQKPIIVEDISNSTSNQTQQSQSKTIYITKEDLEAMLPGLAGKLDATKILSSLTSKATLSKLLSSLGVISIKSMEETSKSSEQSKQENTTEKPDHPKTEQSE